MIKKFKGALKKEDNKRVFSNFISLSFLQGANLILPLITFPYLVRILGIEKYGLIIFAQAFIAYFSTLTNYGFDLSGTREISINKNKIQKLIKTYNSILIARIWLVLLGLIVMSIIVFSVEKFTSEWKLYFLTYGIVVGTAMFPTWFFQGMEKMKFITILTLISKAIFTISIFIFVRTPEDYLLVPSLNAIGSIFVAIVSLMLINKKFGIPFKGQKNKYVLKQFQNGWYIFLSSISINLYSNTTTFVLGLVTNSIMVGYYGIAVKVVKIIISLFTPFYQAIYPHIVQLLEKSKLDSTLLLKKVLKYTFLISIVVWLIGFIFAEPMFYLVFGKGVNHSIMLFRLLSPLIIVLPIAYVMFNLVMLSFKMDKYFLKIYVTGALLNIGLLVIFLFWLKLSTVGAAISLMICETTLTIYAGILLYKHKINVFSFFRRV